MHISLDMDDFECLISGGVLHAENQTGDLQIKICLKDIGYSNMQNIIENARIGIPKYGFNEIKKQGKKK